MQIYTRFNFDRWELIGRYGFHETLIADCSTRKEAETLAEEYRELERTI
jgi:hypothetical protein